MPDVRLDVFNKVCPIPAAMTRKEVLKLEKKQKTIDMLNALLDTPEKLAKFKELLEG